MKKTFAAATGLPALILSMVIWGTVGIFRRYIPLPSGLIALARGGIGTLFLVFMMLIGKKKPQFALLRKHLIPLLLSGAFLGANWILFFESYNEATAGHTGVAVATVCYYMAPLIVTLLAPWVLGEKWTLKKTLCLAVAFGGMVLVSAPWREENSAQLRGMLLALGAAVLYAWIVLLNKRMAEVPPLDRTVAQLGISAVVLLPYTLLFESWEPSDFTPSAVICLIVIGLLHTGIAYALYFGSIGTLKAQTAALCSYIDPALAILLSAVFLREPIGILGALGAALVIGAALVGEISFRRKKTELS